MSGRREGLLRWHGKEQRHLRLWKRKETCCRITFSNWFRINEQRPYGRYNKTITVNIRWCEVCEKTWFASNTKGESWNWCTVKAVSQVMIHVHKPYVHWRSDLSVASFTFCLFCRQLFIRLKSLKVAMQRLVNISLKDSRWIDWKSVAFFWFLCLQQLLCL